MNNVTIVGNAETATATTAVNKPLSQMQRRLIEALPDRYFVEDGQFKERFNGNLDVMRADTINQPAYSD